MCELRNGKLFPPTDEYLNWVINKRGNDTDKLQAWMLRDYPSRFGLSRPQMIPLLKVFTGFGMFLENKGLGGGLTSGEGRNLGKVLDRQYFLDFAAWTYLGFDSLLLGESGKRNTTLAALYPTIDNLTRQIRTQLNNDTKLQQIFPGIGLGINQPTQPTAPETGVTLALKPFDPRPFMAQSGRVGSTGSVQNLERVSLRGFSSQS